MYTPSERTNITWDARNRSWRYLSPESRARAEDFPVKFQGLQPQHLPDNGPGQVVREWIERWGKYPTSGLSLTDNDGRGRGLWLHGEPGHGKTRMASIAGQYVSALGWSTKFISAANLYSLHRQVMDERGDEDDRPLAAAAAALEDWDGWRAVVLDDLGKEYHTASGYAENLFDRIIRNRYSSGAPTIVTTNYTPSQIAEEYNDSMHSYIQEAFWIVKVSDKDYRRGR